jgi:hypothetical protein
MRYEDEVFFCLHALSLLVRMVRPMKEAIAAFESLHVETIARSRQTLAIVESLQTLAFDTPSEFWVLWKADMALATAFQGARRLTDRMGGTCS